MPNWFLSRSVNWPSDLTDVPARGGRPLTQMSAKLGTDGKQALLPGSDRATLASSPSVIRTSLGFGGLYGELARLPTLTEVYDPARGRSHPVSGAAISDLQVR